MPSYQDLFQVHLAYLEYVRRKSYVIHQYLSNIGATGSGVEDEVRALLRSILPERFRVTHGYIVKAIDHRNEPVVSPQVDVIIVDTLVPHSLWLVDPTQGIEIVPTEAVVGVIEVKRTLTVGTFVTGKPAAGSLVEAIGHLREIAGAVLVKDDPTGYMPGGMAVGAGLKGPYYGNPVLGIISLACESDFSAAPQYVVPQALMQLDGDGDGPLYLDFVLSVDGVFVATADAAGSNFRPIFVRSSPAERWLANGPNTGSEPRVALAHGLGFLLEFIGHVCGRFPELDKYFFNSSIA